MFCSGCGAKLQEGTAFCSGCGAKTGGGGVAVAVQEAPVVQQTMMVRDFRCNGCGNPLKIPTNSRAPVKCPSCKTECIIDGLFKNAEMAAKENINSGISLNATPAMLHQKLIRSLCKYPTLPLDVFSKSEVIREERYCIPAYCYYCNGTASFTYDAGNERQQVVVRDTGDKSWEETRRHTEYTQMSSSASASATLFTSGNKEVAPQIKELYMFLDPNKLEDYEYLIFPNDVLTYDFNLPQAAAFNEYAKPYMDELLRRNAIKSLSGKNYRSLTMGGSNIQKDDVIRVFLGLYRIIYKYGDYAYSLWVTGDGERFLEAGQPLDQQRQQHIAQMQQAMASVPSNKNAKLGCLFWGSIIAAIPTIGISLILTLILGITSSKNKKQNAANDMQRGQIQWDINNFNGELEAVKQQFIGQKKALRGIYESVSDDPNAF
jgi:hypothetical protein